MRSLDLLMQVSLILEGNGLETEAFLAPAGLMDRHQFSRPLLRFVSAPRKSSHGPELGRYTIY